MTRVWGPGAEFGAGALPVLSSGVTLAEGSDGTTQRYPTVQVDVRRRPDVADLPRVHTIEGPGLVRTTVRLLGTRKGRWRLGLRRDLLRLDVEVTSPVSCTFGVVLDVARHRHLLEHVVESRTLVLATSTPGAELGPSWLALSLDTEVIRDLLAEVDASTR